MHATMPLIGIPCATYQRPFPYPMTHGNNETYIHALERAHAVPILIPLVRDTTVLRAAFDRIDGLLLAGGADVDPKYYGEEPHQNLGKVNAEQDRVELQLIEWAREINMPVFAICRGLQILNVAYGGTLYQDIPSQYTTNVNHSESFHRDERDLMVHQLQLAGDSKIAQFIGEEDFPINTLHHQAIKDLAPSLRATGWSDDGLIEAIEDPSKPWVVGVQCHPEELVRQRDHRWLDVFESFAQACVAWRNTRLEAGGVLVR